MQIPKSLLGKEKLLGFGGLRSAAVPGKRGAFLPFLAPSPLLSSEGSGFILQASHHQVTFNHSISWTLTPFWWVRSCWEVIKTGEQFSRSSFPLADNSWAPGFTSDACNLIFSFSIIQIQTLTISQPAKLFYQKSVAGSGWYRLERRQWREAPTGDGGPTRRGSCKLASLHLFTPPTALWASILPHFRDAEMESYRVLISGFGRALAKRRWLM